jgi:hypothetical protein
VDVVVANRSSQAARLTGAFTYFIEQPYTLTPSTNTVVAGAQLILSWTAPRGAALDWIGFFLVGHRAHLASTDSGICWTTDTLTSFGAAW